jgi:hypothetical protein
MFLDAWEAIAFADLPSAILQKVGERYNQVSEYWVAIHLIASVRFIPLLEFLDEVRIRALISQVLFGKCYAYFDAMVALGREDVTRWLYHAVISTGNVPMFLKYAHDTFASYKVDTGDLVETLVYGKPEIMAILLQRASFEVWPNLLRYAQRILAEAGTGKHKARKVETARLVVARADASQRHTLSWASSSSSSSSFYRLGVIKRKYIHPNGNFYKKMGAREARQRANVLRRSEGEGAAKAKPFGSDRWAKGRQRRRRSRLSPRF